jgi:hypothetical protein
MTFFVFCAGWSMYPVLCGIMLCLNRPLNIGRLYNCSCLASTFARFSIYVCTLELVRGLGCCPWPPDQEFATFRRVWSSIFLKSPCSESFGIGGFLIMFRFPSSAFLLLARLRYDIVLSGSTPISLSFPISAMVHFSRPRRFRTRLPFRNCSRGHLIVCVNLVLYSIHWDYGWLMDYYR